MAIKINDKIPSVNVKIIAPDGVETINTSKLFESGKIVMFGVPGAFTPTCSAKHLPSYLENYDNLKAKGVEKIICLSVNDAFVMAAWAKHQKSETKIIMLADGSSDFTKALGLELDARAFGMGMRAQRFALIAQNGVVKNLFIEQAGEYKVSSAQHMVENI